MKPEKAEVQLHHPREARPVKITADAAVSISGLQGGRMLPLLLLDTSDRPDIAELIRVHESFGLGDVKIQWGRLPEHDGTVALFLTFIRPMELFMVLEFSIVRQGILVEQALTGQGIYLAQSRHTGDRFSHDLDRPRVIVEVGDTGFRETWDDLFYKHLVKDFRAKGLGRSDSKRAARSAIEELRKLGSLRMHDARH